MFKARSYLRSLAKPIVIDYLARRAQDEIAKKWEIQNRVRTPHQLPFPVVVSLTSYPPRFQTLGLTIKSLLLQTVRPNKTILWIAESDRTSLPANVLELQECGLDICYCKDIKSYKKIIPVLDLYPGAAIVTADDDLFYWEMWLEELLNSHCADRKEVLCHRAHRIVLGPDGLPVSYSKWVFNVKAGASSSLLFPTGVSGIFYPPKVFHSDVSDARKFEKLCPTGDDIWLYWMASLGGAKFRKIGKVRPLVMWKGSQQEALFNINSGGDNDIQILNMMREYGLPPGLCKEKVVF